MGKQKIRKVKYLAKIVWHVCGDDWAPAQVCVIRTLTIMTSITTAAPGPVLFLTRPGTSS